MLPSPLGDSSGSPKPNPLDRTGVHRGGDMHALIKNQLTPPLSASDREMNEGEAHLRTGTDWRGSLSAAL